MGKTQRKGCDAEEINETSVDPAFYIVVFTAKFNFFFK